VTDFFRRKFDGDANRSESGKCLTGGGLQQDSEIAKSQTPAHILVCGPRFVGIDFGSIRNKGIKVGFKRFQTLNKIHPRAFAGQTKAIVGLTMEMLAYPDVGNGRHHDQGHQRA
jgi:hypothetical protein